MQMKKGKRDERGFEERRKERVRVQAKGRIEERGGEKLLPLRIGGLMISGRMYLAQSKINFLAEREFGFGFVRVLRCDSRGLNMSSRR